MQLKGNSTNVCSGKLQEMQNRTWEDKDVPADKTERDKHCQAMHCGVSANNSDGDMHGTHMTCTGDSCSFFVLDYSTTCNNVYEYVLHPLP